MQKVLRGLKVFQFYQWSLMLKDIFACVKYLYAHNRCKIKWSKMVSTLFSFVDFYGITGLYAKTAENYRS